MENYLELLEIYNENPNDENAREDLVFSLTQYLLDNIDQINNNEYKESLHKLESILQECNDDKYLYDKGAIAYINKDLNIFVELFKNYIENLVNKNESNIYDIVAKDFLGFIDYVDADYILKLSEKVNAVSLSIGQLLLGMYNTYIEDNDNGLMIYQKLMDEDSNNWIAAVLSAETYYEQKNWKPAIKSYEFALRSNSQVIGQIPEIFFSLAWCYGRIKEYETESINYQKCLDIDKNMENALNNLGYSYVRQKRYKEALKIFNKCIEEKRDGKYPYSNKVRALKGLKRYREALKFIEDKIADGIFTTKSMASDIEKLNKWINLQQDKNQSIIIEKDIEKDLEIEIENSEPLQTEKKSEIIIKKKATFATPNERLLEELIEECILKGKKTFDRNLSMYEDDRYYGRQLIMPDIGRIDLLAIDNDSNDLIVIELKQGKSDDVVVGQILRYMGWLNEKLAKPNQNVKGIICVNEITPKLKSAVSVVPTIELYEYGVSLNKK